MREGLPTGWALARVGDCFADCGGGTPNRGTAGFWGGDIPWLSSGDIKSAEIETASETITSLGLENSAARMCRRGSVVVVVRSGILKHTLPVAILKRDAAINQDLKAFDSGHDELNRWLSIALRASESDLLAMNREGTTVQSVKLDTLKDFALPTPPLEEQRRIIAKLETLLAKVDTSRKRLERIPVILKRFRQAVLAAACEGRLTEDWREANAKPGIESWATKQMRELFLVRTGGTPSRKEKQYYAGGTIPWVKTGEVQNGPITSASEFITPLAVSESNAKIFPAGTILIALYGDGKTRGQVGRLTFPAATNQACAALLSDSLPEITFKYVFNFWLSQYQSLRDESAGGNQQNLNLGIIKDWEISLPPEDEQAEIVRLTKDLLTLADQIEARYVKAKAQVDRLTQSILAKAFRGELVPQDPNDEPADALLSRLGAAPAEASAPARRRGRSPRVQPAAPPVVPAAPAEVKEAPDREAPALADLTPEAILQAHREVLASIPSPLSEDNLLRAVAFRLGFQRLGGRIKARLRETLAEANSNFDR